MESSFLLVAGMSPKQPPARRHVNNRDLWAAVRNGSVHDVELALAHLKKTNGSVDARNAFGSSALHIAVWKNHLPIVRRLLAAGADPNIRDGESGWSSLHRALHFGHLAVAGVLIEAGGSLVLEDSKGRTPVDLTSIPLKQSLGSSNNPGAKEVFSWGNGSNYQLGIGITGILRVPGRVDALQGLNVTAVAAAKFHSVALTDSGDVYSWGFGRGGRLGHPDFDIHSGQVAVITPRQITNSFGSQAVSVIAVAKHHTVVATFGGAVYTWGSNREGRLGYPSVDTQPTPRRVSTLKAKVVAVAAANKHSAVLTDAGEVYTWGCNTEGQLGYGTSNSISNSTPRLVECLQGKKFVAVSTAKYHTIVLGAEGEVLTWGYRQVNPRRIPVVRYTKKAGSLPLKFHISERLHLVSISAGMTHSLALSEDGLVFYWFSADRQLRCHQLLSMAGHQALAASSSKYRTAVITSTGDVFSWDGENSKADKIPLPLRVQGIKHAMQLSVGENHSVVVAAVFTPEYPLPCAPGTMTSNQPLSPGDDVAMIDLELEDEGLSGEVVSPQKRHIGAKDNLKTLPSLKDLCQRVAAQVIVEPKNALQVLEFADALGADFLREHCEEMVLRNLDYVLTVAPVLFGHVRPSLLARVEKASSSCSTHPLSQRRFSSATSVAIVDSEDEEVGSGSCASSGHAVRELSTFNTSSDGNMREGFLQQSTEYSESIVKQVRAVRKKLQQIEALELKQARGLLLDDQQVAKLQTKEELEHFLLSLETGVIPDLKEKRQEEGVKKNSYPAESSGRDSPQSRTSGSQQSRRLEKKKSKRRGSSESLHSGPDKRDESATPITEKQSVEKSMFSRSDITTVNNSGSGFVRIAGFTSLTATDSELKVQPVHKDVELKNGEKNGSSLPSERSPGLGKALPPVLLPVQPPLPRKMTTLGKRVAKGGLSVFLSGALDEIPKAVVPAPTTPKVEVPAWGGVHGPTGLLSLRDIQSQQKAEPKLVFSQALKVGSGSSSTLDRSPSSLKQDDTWQVPGPKLSANSKQADKFQTLGSGSHSAGDRSASNSKQGGSSRLVPGTKLSPSPKQADKSQIPVEETHRVALSQFVRTSPIPVTNSRTPASAQAENSPPPWAASTTSAVALSLRDIQLEQVKSKAHQRPSHSGGSPSLSSPVSAQALSTSGSGPEHNLKSLETPNRWFKPEVGSSSTLRCIQIEEKAMKELGQLYKNVKLVRNDGS